MKQKEDIRYQDRRQNRLEGKYWKGGGVLLNAAVFGLLALFVAPLVFARPAQASDNKIGITLNTSEVVLKRDKNLYQSGVNTITVNGELSGGFNVTLSAKDANLVDSKDSTHIIKPFESSKTDKVSGLAENQWGYRMGKEGDFSIIPADSTGSVIISNDGKNLSSCKSANQCTKDIMFAANINPNNLASGEYSTKVTYIVTPRLIPGSAIICKSGDPSSDCQVDLDPGMIPVKYTGTTTDAKWTSLAAPENPKQQGEWYDYDKKQWANAVTVKDPKKYKNQAKTVDPADILGFWVYIPRYAYEVMRRDGTDKPVGAQNFDIKFEKANTPKKRPAACMTGKGKDYRDQCRLDRNYVKNQPRDNGTWATHPAFTFGKKELNGIWFAKFEMTGTSAQPTVLPNERHINGYHSSVGCVGDFYALAKTIGVNDPKNVGGTTDGVNASQNNHHLAKLSSHMVNNNDWGAVVYLSASKYGAGYNKVQANSNAAKYSTYGDTYGITGCGPWEDGDASSYGNSKMAKHSNIRVGAIDTPQACGVDNPQRAYNGTIGQLASTTNNPTGIYDMSGGGEEYIAAGYNYNGNLNDTNTYYFTQPAHPPYANIYNIHDMNDCTFATCGGQALYETSDGLGNHMWNDQYISFGDYYRYNWLNRGGSHDSGASAGLFYVGDGRGDAGSDSTFRVALAPTV